MNPDKKNSTSPNVEQNQLANQEYIPNSAESIQSSGETPFQRIRSTGFFKAMRTVDAFELLKANKSAFALLWVIAARARYQDGFNADGLERGEAMLGDYTNYDMSEREYRTAKQQLQKWQFATFRTTNRGTLGKLMDERVFNPLNIPSDEQKDTQATVSRQASDGQATTNKKDKKEKNEKKVKKQSTKFSDT